LRNHYWFIFEWRSSDSRSCGTANEKESRMALYSSEWEEREKENGNKNGKTGRETVRKLRDRWPERNRVLERFLWTKVAPYWIKAPAKWKKKINEQQNKSRRNPWTLNLSLVRRSPWVSRATENKWKWYRWGMKKQWK
jgi:hypothetical protein